MGYGHDRTYKKVEVIGVSKNGIEDAIQVAVNRASHSLNKVSWFEIGEIHGHVGNDGKVDEFQVIMKVAFELE